MKKIFFIWLLFTAAVFGNDKLKVTVLLYFLLKNYRRDSLYKERIFSDPSLYVAFFSALSLVRDKLSFQDDKENPVYTLSCLLFIFV